VSIGVSSDHGSPRGVNLAELGLTRTRATSTREHLTRSYKLEDGTEVTLSRLHLARTRTDSYTKPGKGCDEDEGGTEDTYSYYECDERETSK